MSDDVLQQIEADIAEAERLITECRLQIAARKSAGEDTARSEQRVLEMVKGRIIPPANPEPPSVGKAS